MKYDISALGNALVDTQYMVDHDFLNDIGLEPDSMTLASAEEHSPIINKLQDMGAESVSDCGGSATNSLVAASYYGSNCHHVCRVANDEDGKKYLDSLHSAGVKHIGFSKEDSDLPTGKCLIFVTPDAKRTMSSMLGISAYLGPKDIDYDAVDNSKIFYIEGYMVTSDENFSAVTSVLKNINSENTLKALSLSDAGIVHGFKDKFKEIESYGIDMIFCNDDEAVAFAGTDSLEDAVEFYKKQSYMIAITKGAEGSIVIKGEQQIFSPAISITPVDTNGAGDMYAGSFMHAYLNGFDLSKCAEFSNYASSKVVQTFGPRLSSDGYENVLNKLRKS
ncbi:MAG: adenosine kinase [Gammaproteobacteria bacterium]|tara:strand:+ start:5158 stop:6159 length:1002 start_codon:yes stop_codon:yes gene_type:complete